MRSRLVISFTTVPWRVNNLEHILQHLHMQTRIPDAIYLSIADKCRRGDVPYPSIPDELFQKYPNFAVVRCKEDYGAICKIFGALEEEDDTIIITIDDDFKSLPPNLLEHFQEQCDNSDRNVAWAVSGGQIGKFPFLYGWINYRSPKFYFLESTVNNNELQIIFGCNGVAYRRSFFPHSENEWKNFFAFGQTKSLKMHDDIWISSYLNSINIKCKLVPKARTIRENFPFIGGNDGLSSQWFKFYYHYFNAISDAKKIGAFKNVEGLDNPTSSLTFQLIILIIIIITPFVLFFFISYNTFITILLLMLILLTVIIMYIVI